MFMLMHRTGGRGMGGGEVMGKEVVRVTGMVNLAVFKYQHLSPLSRTLPLKQ